jgi:hypothetical protein
MNANNNLKLVFSAVALVLLGFGLCHVVGAIAHQVFVLALCANAQRNAFILVGIQLE